MLSVSALLPAAAGGFLVNATTYRARAPGDLFGQSVAATGAGRFSGCTPPAVCPPSDVGLVVGAPAAAASNGVARAGRVDVYSNAYLAEPSDAFESPSPVPDGGFGAAVAGTPGDVIVGAPGEAGTAGRVYRFGAGGPQTFAAPVPVPGAAFGAALAAAPSVGVIVGAPAPEDAQASGSAFVVDLLGGASIALERPSPTPGALYGVSVAVADTPPSAVAFVGAPFEQVAGAAVGAVYAFDVRPANPGRGSLLRSMPNPRTDAAGTSDADGFGSALATGGDHLLAVGAPLADAGGVEGVGRVYVLDADPASDSFGSVLATLEHPAPQADAGFGAAVAFVEETDGAGGTTRPALVVGAPLDDTAGVDAGALYVFDADRSSPSFGTSAGRLVLTVALNFAHLGTSLASLGIGGELAAGAPGPVGSPFGLAGVVQAFANCGDGVLAGEQCEGPAERCSAQCVLGPQVCGGITVFVTPENCPDVTQQQQFCDCGQTAGCPCDDGIACTVNDTCTGAGAACAGTPDASRCDDGNPCTDDRCDPVAGCVHDQRACPEDEDPCTFARCDPASGSCTQTRKDGCVCAADADCDDGEACNGVERCVRCRGCAIVQTARPCCSAERTCRVEFAATPSDPCDDHDRCTVDDRCDAALQCKGQPLTGLEGVACAFSEPQVDVDTLCANQPVGSIKKAIGAARTRAARAQQTQRAGKRRRLVRQALAKLNRAQTLTDKRQRRLTQACRDGLHAAISPLEASTRAFLEGG